MGWELSMLPYMALGAGCVWSCLRHADPHLGTIGRYISAAAVFALIAGAGSFGTINQYGRKHPQKVTANPNTRDSPTANLSRPLPNSVVPHEQPHLPPVENPALPSDLPHLAMRFFRDAGQPGFALVNPGRGSALRPKWRIALRDYTNEYYPHYPADLDSSQPLLIPTNEIDAVYPSSQRPRCLPRIAIGI
jgi:hypothetical protein